MCIRDREKPDVDYIDGLSPAISIDQKTTSKNPRSTVGTVTEIYDYLRLLWARVGTPHCPKCGKEIQQQTIDQIIDQVMALPEATRIPVSYTHLDVYKRQAVVLAHNHVSGIAFPSEDDIATTRSLAPFLAKLGVELVDHLIFVDDDMVSLRDSGFYQP